ncbi:MAG: L-asparaginase [Actinomycetia bacterium]|nr:L-asparaginase [Actinomycetes bacterium]
MASPGPRVVVFSTGGTIAMGRSAGSGGVAPSLTGADLVAAVPQLAEIGVDVEVRDFRQVPSASLTFADVVELAGEIRRALDGGATGAVVTQGTDTIEETSYLLDLLHGGDEPVIVTGAMRNPTMAGADGPANLLAAIQSAASPVTRGLGCLVVFADELQLARTVRKTHTTSIAAFTSPGSGPIGFLREGQPQIAAAPPRRPALPAPPPGKAAPRIALHTATLGDDPALLEAVAGLADGVVVAALGAGHVSAAMVPVLAGLARRIPVVLTSRTGAGPVLSATYGFPGSESDLLGRRLISGGTLHPLKARILLQLLVAGGAGHAAIAEAFAAG